MQFETFPIPIHGKMRIVLARKMYVVYICRMKLTLSNLRGQLLFLTSLMPWFHVQYVACNFLATSGRQALK